MNQNTLCHRVVCHVGMWNYCQLFADGRVGNVLLQILTYPLLRSKNSESLKVRSKLVKVLCYKPEGRGFDFR
jgi:hypothetical protein